MNKWGVQINRYHDLAVLIANKPDRNQFLGQLKVADTGWQRLLGWRNRGDCLGVWLIPCKSVHTLGMRNAIDLLWLNQERKIVAVDWNVSPDRWRLRSNAYSVIELPAGVLAAHGLVQQVTKGIAA